MVSVNSDLFLCIRFYLNAVMLTHYVFCSCFCTTMAELSRGDRAPMPPDPPNSYHLMLYRTFAALEQETLPELSIFAFSIAQVPGWDLFPSSSNHKSALCNVNM